MISFFKKYHRPLFYSAWVILGLLQSASTELIADEAYYWVYSKYLSWGYFDHPPMIALLVKWGYALFQNELGIRLIPVLLNTFTVLILEKLTEKKNPFLFYAIILSAGALQLAGFLAVPDTPMLFFTALFFYCYKNFAAADTWKNAIWLGLVTALLFYSKYHGVLIVFFTLLSNLKLLGRWPTWLAGCCVLLFYSPHLLWQWEHNWVSFRYHLFESNVNTYKFSYTAEYLLGQLLLAGPIAGLILLPAAFLYKTKTTTEKAFKLTMIGVYSVFLFSSLRGKVEVNWPSPALVPLIILSHQFIIDKIAWQRPLRILLPLSLLFVMACRVYLVMDIGRRNGVKAKFHGNKEWAKAVSKKTGKYPVVFYNSYQRASLFWFYGGKPSHSLNAFTERRSNYNFWPTEDELLGRPVYVADIYTTIDFTDSVQSVYGRIGWRFDSLFASLGSIDIIPEKKTFTAKNGKSFSIKCESLTPGKYIAFLAEHPEIKTELLVGIFDEKGLIKEISTGITAQQIVKQPSFYVPLNTAGLVAGNYYIRFALRSKNYPPTHNSKKINLVIE